MVDGSSEDRHSVCDGNRPVKIQCLCRNMALIVIEGKYTVEASLCRLMEDGIGTDRSRYRVAFRLQLVYGRHNFPSLLITEQTMLAAVRV